MTRKLFVVVIAAAALSSMAAPHTVDAQAPAAPTYSRDIAPILYRNCTN